jgi:hypothetical protein
MTRYKKAKKFTKIQKGLSRNIQTVKIVLIITTWKVIHILFYDFGVRLLFEMQTLSLIFNDLFFYNKN